MAAGTEVGVATHPGNRYGTLNQDYATFQEFYGAGETSKGSQQVYVATICDGHGVLGEKAASYAGKALVRHLYNSGLRGGKPLCGRADELQVEVKAGFRKGHAAALAIYDDPPREVQYPNASHSMATYSLSSSPHTGMRVYRDRASCERIMEFGCTCTCAVVQASTVCLANVGDSAAVLGSDTGASYTSTTLTVHHNGRHPDEAKRLQQLAGKVKCEADGYLHVLEGPWMGYELAVSRALGHKHMEEYGVIPDPHVMCFEAKPEDCCLILASDGVWDAMDGQEAVNRVMEAVGEGKSAAQAARILVEDAVELGMGSPCQEADNTSAIVMLFR